MKNLPEIQLTVENAEEEIIKLMQVVKPAWKKDQMDLKKLSGGLSCLMYRCLNKENHDDGVTIRARTTTFQDFPHVRDSAYEAEVLKTMHNKNLFPEILATFKNGFCYTYIKGEPIYSYTQSVFSLNDTKLRLMARTLAEIHSIKIEGFDYSETNYFRNIYLIIEEKYPVKNLPAGLPSRDQLKSDLELVKSEAILMNSPLVLCHGDPHPGNIVYDEEKGIVTYVDWELSRVGYQAADVAAALQVLKVLGWNPAIKMDLPDDVDRKYIRYYLEKWFEIQGMERDVTEEDVDKLEAQANIFRLSACLFWISVMAAQFTVGGIPDHVDTEEFKKVMDAAVEAQANAEVDTSSKMKLDANRSPQESMTQMVSFMYDNYLMMKDEILSNGKSK